MDNSEALYAIFSGIETNEQIKMGENPYFDVMISAEKALEKQIPKKPICIDKVRFSYKCGLCNKKVWGGMNLHFNFCPECGQKLDWSE